MTGPAVPGQVVWLDGALVPVDDARVSVFDHGLTVGDGVFETMKVVAHDGGAGTTRPGFEAFALDRHLRRLRRSLDAMGLALTRSDEDLRDAVHAVVEANGGPAHAGRVRITVTGGVAPLGSGRGPDGVTVVVASGPAAPWPPTSSVVTVPWVRNERGATAGLKTTSYADNVIALRFAHERGGDEAVFANTLGNLCEGTGSNVFVEVDGRLVTPPLSAGCLAGVTREIVLELFAGEIEERDVPLAALGASTEAFLTSSTRDIHPIATVDGAALPACPGPLTDDARQRFRAATG